MLAIRLYVFRGRGIGVSGGDVPPNHACLFQSPVVFGAGSVIHAMSDEQDMRKMGGIWKKIPFTYAMMWVGSLALAGVPFFAGYYSKDMVLETAWGAHSALGNLAWYLGIGAAFLTAFYSWRLLMLTFHGTPRAPAKVMAKIHESPPVMTLPLFVLAVGAVLSGWLFYDLFVGHHWHDFWGDALFIHPQNSVMEDAHHVPKWGQDDAIIRQHRRHWFSDNYLRQMPMDSG